MFRRPGKQIMVLAIVFFIIGCILSVVGALSMALTGIGSIMFINSTAIVGRIIGIVLKCIAILLGGLVASWLFCLFLYAFGKLVDGADLAATYSEKIFVLLNDMYPADAAPAQNNAKTPSANANTDPFA
jgi:hypothetical protein